MSYQSAALQGMILIMQTFMPYPDFRASLECLDPQRLNKQGVEAYQVLRQLLGLSSGWSHHPAVKMWSGSERALLEYAMIARELWISSGGTDNMIPDLWTIEEFLIQLPSSKPSWMGFAEFHDSHKSNLKRKLPGWYGLLWPWISDDLPYVWPTWNHSPS